MEQFPTSGSGGAGGHPRVEQFGNMMPAAGVCLSQARVLAGLVMSNGLIRARSLICRADQPNFTSYNPDLHFSHLCT